MSVTSDRSAVPVPNRAHAARHGASIPRAFRRSGLFRSLLALAGALTPPMVLLPIVAAVAIVAAQAASAPPVVLGRLTLSQAWARATPHGAAVAGAYLTIENKGDVPDRLVAITTEVAGRASAHEMAMKDGVMTMRPLADGLVVPPHAGVTLKPGGFHLMLEQLEQPLLQGKTFTATLTFEKAGAAKLMFSIESVGAKAPEGDTAAAGGAAPAMDAHMKMDKN